MMRHILAGLLFVVFGMSGLLATEESMEAQGRSIQPCTSWSYDSGGRGYVCRFYDRVNVAEDRDVQDLEYDMRALQTKITDLERRVKDLEGRR